MHLETKKLLAFDLDGTLAPSKSQMDAEMAGLVLRLIDSGKKIAVMSGGAMPQYEKQFLSALSATAGQLKNIFLFPTCGAAFYRYKGSPSTLLRADASVGQASSPTNIRNWQLVYEERLSEEDGRKIKTAFETVFAETAYAHPERVFGELIEFRGTQMTFTGLGQDAPHDLKQVWDPQGERRLALQAALAKYIPEYDVKLGGTTSLDITRRGVDKAYGIAQMEKYLGVSKREILYFGDAIFPGGNDYPVKLAGVDCVAVSGYNETKLKLGEFFGN